MDDIKPFFYFGLSIDCVIFGFDKGELKDSVDKAQ
jgi:hypothetical protein